MTNWRFLGAATGVAAVVFGIAAWLNIDYLFFAGYVVLQYVVLASAWNILGGYTGYMNLGISGFFALGAYTTVALDTAWKLPLPATIPAAAIVSCLVGLGMGYLTLRLKGIFFAIATLALAVVTETFITNWDYVGGSAGAYGSLDEAIECVNGHPRPLALYFFGADNAKRDEVLQRTVSGGATVWK